jgi:hypothetical protein
MPTYFNFQPSTAAPFQFQPVLDGSPYIATVPWLAFAKRFYLNLLASDGTQIIYTALVGSPTGVAIQALSWAMGRASATTVAPHGYKVGRVISLTVVGCLPAAYNGVVAALITGQDSFSWALAANPGAASVLGNANYDINLLGGVPNENGQQFKSTLVFRAQSQQFEVN